jgi:aminoglycoside phosphotransferase (APT) family kinase protein
MAPDPRAILASLGVADARSVEPVKGGEDTLLWRVETPAATYALRLMRREQQPVAAREATAMRAAAAAGIPVPTVHQSTLYEERPVMLLGWCPGRTLLAELAEQPWRVWELGRLLGRAHARLNRVAAPAALPERWRAWAGDPVLAAALPPGDRLLHLDFHPLNVMTDGSTVTAVIDWTNTSAGDPRADAARALAILLLSPTDPSTPRAFAVLRRILVAAYWSGYGRLDGMAPFHVWAARSMLRDVAPRVADPKHWMTDAQLTPVRRWRDYWARR